MNPAWLRKDFYRLLEVDENADQAAVEESYRRLIGELRPETSPDDALRYSLLTEAYSVLADSARREEYDRMRAADAEKPAAYAPPPPQAPRSGPWRWMRENLFDGEWWGPIAGNTALTLAVALIGLNLSRFITSYLFDPGRKWSALTYNMKLLMVQAFPQDDMIRIWLSIGILAVLAVWSLASWEVGGRLPLTTLLRRLRFGGGLLAVAAVMHHGAGARTFGLPPVLQIDAPADWSSPRVSVFLVGAAAAVGSHLLIKLIRRPGAAADGEDTPERSVPALALPVIIMAAVSVFLWTARLPVPEGQFEETTGPIAATTARPWTILFAATVAAYFLGLLIQRRYPQPLRRFLLIAWFTSYPVIIMIIQRKPILHWMDILGFGETSFFASDLGTVLTFVILGGAAIWVLALPRSKAAVTGAAAGIGLLILASTFIMEDPPAWLTTLVPIGGLAIDLLLGGLIAAALTAGAWLVADRYESVRLIGSVLMLVAVMVWLRPMPFLFRVLTTVFALAVLLCPTFGGTPTGRRNLVAGWGIAVLVVVSAFRLGIAETGLEYQSTTFLGGFNLTILLAFGGIALSFPLGVILALGRTSSMPIFRLVCTGYIELVRSVPLITWLFFGASMLVAFLPQGVEFDELVGVIGALALFNSAYLAETIRGGLQSINRGQYEAARAVGLSTVQSTSLVIMPQALRAVIPALVGQVIVSFKDTSLVAIIGLTDVLLIARSIIPQQSNPSFQGTIAQMMFFMALFYWVFTFAFSRSSMRVERNVGLGER